MRKFIITFAISFIILLHTTFAYAVDNIKQYTLPSGQTVIIKEVNNNPIVIIDTFIKTGSINENDQNNGVAHFLEHLFFKGTTNHKRGEFERAIEKRGGVFNAATSRDYTHYYIKIDSKYFNEALTLHSDMLLNIAIPQNELDMERKVVMEEITRSNDNPNSKLFDNFMKIIFNGEPYARKILGTNEIISKISRDEIMAFHDTWYTPENMVTVVIGDVKAEKILPQIEKNFKISNKNCNSKVSPSNPSKITLKDKKIIEYADVDTAYLILGYPSVGTNNLKEAYALGLASEILAGGQNSILYKILKEDENLILDASAGNYELKNKGIFYVTASFEPKNYDIVLSKIKNEINNLKTKPIDERHLQLIKNASIREFEYSAESIANIANILGHSVAVGNGISDYTNYLSTIESITPEFIHETVNKYFKDDKLVVAVLLPKNNKKISSAKNIINISNKTKLNNAKLISCYKNIKKYKLPNGATLLLEKNNNNNVIATKIFLTGGSLYEQKSGTAKILSDTITLGTKTKSAKELADALDNIGTSISVEDNFEYFDISMKTTNYDFNQAFNLMKEILEQPAFSEKDITNAKKDTLDAIKSDRDNPQNIAFDNYFENLYANSKFLKTNRILEKTIPTITTPDVINLHKDVFAPKNMIISVVGNFDENDIINKFSELQNSPNSKLIDKSQLKISLPQLNENIIKQESKNSKGAWIVQGWKTQGLSSNDFVTLKLISIYLGSGFTSKLFENLREKKGLAYEVGASSTSDFNQGNFFMYIGTNPNNIEEVKQDFAKEIQELKTKKISEKELCDIKSMLIGRLKLSQETNMSKAYAIGYYEFFDKGYQFSYDYPKMIQNVTVSDILNIANKYFSQPFIMSIVAEDKYIKR